MMLLFKCNDDLTVGTRGSHGSRQKFVAGRTPVGILRRYDNVAEGGRVVAIAAATSSHH
jgi:hypothetical protein